MRIPLPAHPQNLHLAPVRLLQPFQDLDGGGLSRSVGPEQSEALAALHVQVQRPDRDRFSEAFVQPPAANGEPDQRRSASSFHSPLSMSDAYR